MQTLELDMPWQPCQEVASLPEAQLIYSIIKKAWEDSMLQRNTPIRKEARRWFFSKPFEDFCHLAQICPSLIQRYASKHWSV